MIYIAIVVSATLLFLILFARRIMATIAELQAAVTKEDTVIASAVTLIKGLAAEVAANKTDPAALDALVADINTQADALGAAVAANTPAAPTPTA